MDIIEPDVIKAAEYIKEPWRKTIEGILETCRRMAEINERFKSDRGKWSRLIGDHGHDGLLPWKKSYCKMLARIGRDPRLRQHVGALPSDTLTLDKLCALTDERFEALIKNGTINPSMKRNEASAETRAERKGLDEERILSLKPVKGKSRTIIIDPPWDYEWLSIAGRAAPGYATMSHEELLDLDVLQWAHDDCHMYLWTTNNFITRAVELMAAWGFQHKTVLTWIKPKIGLGAYFRNSTEHVLFGVRGELRTRSDSIPTHFEAPLGEHSEKPQRFYDIVAAASYLPAIEIFQRTERDGFINAFSSGQRVATNDEGSAAEAIL